MSDVPYCPTCRSYEFLDMDVVRCRRCQTVAPDHIANRVKATLAERR